MNTEFVKRFRAAFENVSMADVARRLKIPHATVRNYYQGRLPAPEVLIKIANETGVSLNWLLIGIGPIYARENPPIDLGRFLEDRIEQMIDSKLSAAPKAAAVVSGFNIEAAVVRLDDPQTIMGEWFEYEGRAYPSDYGVVFFKGWESFSIADKVEAVRDAKRVLDRSL
ncbi:MAG: helix-turn-helix domain-containing protein [Pyrinomonadaceae bacterium]